MATWEDIVRQKMGVPLEGAAGTVGQTVDNLYSKMKALGQFGGTQQNPTQQQIMGQSNPRPQIDQGPNVLANIEYQRRLEEALKQEIARQTAEQKLQNSLEEPMNESGYKVYPPVQQKPEEKYAEGGMVHDEKFNQPRFSQLKELQKKHKKAHAELDASKNPMKFIADNKNMSIPKKGIAF